MGWTVDARVEAMARAARPAMGGWATGASRGLLGKPCCVRGGRYAALCADSYPMVRNSSSRAALTARAASRSLWA